MNGSTSKFEGPHEEPLFIAIPQDDAGFQLAYDQAAATIPQFIEHLQRGEEAHYSAKLSFRDPDESERLGEDQIVYLWLDDVYYHEEEGLFSGTFLSVPPEFQKWHQVGDELAFEHDDIFDWMVLRDGHMHGGFTIRVVRSNLPEAEREPYDRYVGVSVYEPLPI